jgi:hypothetical protein
VTPVERWQQKAGALWQAWINVTGAQPPSLNALMLALAQAQHETHAGDDWPGARNWGACDLRAPNLGERADIAVGALKNGMWLHHDGTYGPVHLPDDQGILQGDSDPNTGAFHVWFAAFPDDVSGAAYFLRIVLRCARAALADEACTPETYATALYLGCYYGGFHAGARPCGKRSAPFNEAELANIGDYAGAIAKILPGIQAALAGWAPPGQVAPDSFHERDTDAPPPDEAPTKPEGIDE